MFNYFKYEHLRAKELRRLDEQMKESAFRQENPFIETQFN